MRKYEYECVDEACDYTGYQIEVGPDKKDSYDEDPHWRRLWHAAPVHFNADGFYATRDDPGGKFQRERRRKRAEARRNNQANE